MRYSDATKVLIEIAAQHGYTLEQVRKRDKHQGIVQCRWEIIHKLRSAGMSFPDIGAIMDRHHSTIMHAWAASKHRGITCDT